MDEMSVFLRVVLGTVVMAVPVGLVIAAIVALRWADREMDEIARKLWGDEAVRK